MKSIRVSLQLILLILLTACSSTTTNSKAERQQEVLNMKDKVLTQLFAKKPSARRQLSSSPGYAVFSNANVNLIFLAAGTGYGVVKDMQSQKHTYMNMAEGGVGFGLGAKDYRLVMVFHSKSAMNNFVESGWTFGGNADAAAKAGKQGTSIEGEAYYGDVTVYTFTESGLALQATIKGTKFWKDKELN